MGKFKVIEPLSNFQIIDLCSDIKYFRGVFMRDELVSISPKRNECMVINYDISSNDGTHWVCLFTKNGESFYFDPFGLNPLPEIVDYCKEPRHFSRFQIQKPNEVICGHYCIYVLIKLSQGVSFEGILDELWRSRYD